MRPRTAVAGLATAGIAVVLARLTPDREGSVAGEPELLRRLADWEPQPPATGPGRALAYVWASPVTLAGVIVGVAGGSRPAVRDGVLVFFDTGLLTGWMLRRRGFRATALGHTVVSRGQPSARLLAHELVHVRQAERLGALFGPVYVALLVRYGYRAHPLERAARRVAARQP